MKTITATSDTTITIQIGDQIINLTKDEAIKLRDQLTGCIGSGPGLDTLLEEIKKPRRQNPHPNDIHDFPWKELKPYLPTMPGKYDIYC